MESGTVGTSTETEQRASNGAAQAAAAETLVGPNPFTGETIARCRSTRPSRSRKTVARVRAAQP